MIYACTIRDVLERRKETINLNGMKIVMYLNVISIFFHLTATETYNNETLYIPLIKWIRSYYSASAVFLLHSSSEDKNFDGMIFKYFRIKNSFII